jgi:signal transduction histidine kinase
MKDEFIATVSHELRTPVTTMVGPLGLLANGAAGEMPEKAKRLVVMAHNNCLRLMRLVNDILDVEKIEAGMMTFEIRRVEVRGLIARAIESNRPLSEQFGVPVRLDQNSADLTVDTDPDRLSQVLINLLSNAVKFSPRGEEVVVLAELRGDTVHITVRDHGPGVPDEFKILIFEKFAQVDATDARQKGGNGLGLSIAKETIDRLGGEIGHVAAVSGGTVFYVDVPHRQFPPSPSASMGV